jgi:predicted RNase H-like HicB family nuclease
MARIKLRLGDAGFWVAECASNPEIASKGKTKLEARAKFRKAVESIETYLESVESDPKFVAMMKRSDEDIKAGRIFTQEEAERFVRIKRRASKSKR